MQTFSRSRRNRFFHEDGCLVREAISEIGPMYAHRCSKESFENVVHAMDETTDENGTSLHDIVRREKLPFTQVNIALEFLKERGLVDVRHRRSYPATDDTYLNGMCEFYALAEEPAAA